ncbi:MAG: imidazolonepropionase [Rhodothermales bacterium]|nr:imidazolonepropionase [Rhodothermales bacterium]
MPVLTDISTLYRCLDEGGQSAVHPVRDAAVAWRNGVIEWAGAARDLPQRFTGEPLASARGACVAPGLVDSHTHLAFGGWRADEFERRLRGESYLDIARSGGGIMRTVEQTRSASDEELVEHCMRNLERMAVLGVTTVECKTGYGLSTPEELRILRLYRKINAEQPLELVSTLLAAHVNPNPSVCDNDCYIDDIIQNLLPAVAEESLARFNDVFVEEGAFTHDQARRLLMAGARLGLAPKLHVDQLGDSGGATLAAEAGAVSADHLEYTTHAGIQAMARAGVVAGCLPIATLYLHQKPMDGRAFVEAGVPVAVATDFNPGSAPSFDLHLAMMLACTMCRLTPAEALKGATIFAARSLSLDDRIGSVEPGKQADLCLIDAKDVNDWMVHFRPNRCVATFVQGRQIAGTPLPMSRIVSGNPS